MPTISCRIEDVDDRLCSLWTTWCKQNSLPCISTDDLLHAYSLDDGTSLTNKQIKFVHAFIKLWEVEHD